MRLTHLAASGDLRVVDEDGVTFRSHVDGAMHRLSPERSMEIQRLLGSDIVMAFDECTPFPATRDEASASMERSMRWANIAIRPSTSPRGRDQFSVETE